MARSATLLQCAAVALLLSNAFASNSSITMAKVFFKLTYVQEGEKMHRAWITANRETVSKIGSEDGFVVGNGDSVSVSASLENAEGEPCSIHQPFLRFLNQRTKADNLFLLKRKGRDMKADINLRLEIKADAEFWNIEDVYTVELVMGDLNLDKSITWTITEKMRFGEDAKPMFKRPERGVFDFDVGVKKTLLPEFSSPIPPPEKRAPLPLVVAALVGVLLPLPMLFIGWSKLGVFPLHFPKEGSRKAALVGFEICLLAHMGALTMFWVKWNIVTTWKCIGALMIPTFICGRKVLSSSDEGR